jgi:hypothetical protein
MSVGRFFGLALTPLTPSHPPFPAVGLWHDDGTGYYMGAGDWAPIVVVLALARARRCQAKGASAAALLGAPSAAQSWPLRQQQHLAGACSGPARCTHCRVPATTDPSPTACGARRSQVEGGRLPLPPSTLHPCIRQARLRALTSEPPPLHRAQDDYCKSNGAVGNQLQNDLEAIATHLQQLLPEDHGSTTAAAAALVSAEPTARARCSSPSGCAQACRPPASSATMTAATASGSQRVIAGGCYAAASRGSSSADCRLAGFE